MNKVNLTVTAIIDASKGLVLGLGAEVQASTNKAGKARNLNTVIFFLSTMVDRPAVEGGTKQVEMSLAERLRMEAYMKAKGATANADYSKKNNSVVFEIPKSGFEAIIGTSYEDTDVEALLNSDANTSFAGFAPEPQVVWSEDILAEEHAELTEDEQKSYQAKQAGSDGEMLTSGGQQIYRKTALVNASWELEDVTIAHEQDLSIANRKTVSKETVKA